MSLNVSDLALARESVGFLAKETTFGTLAEFVAANAFGVIGMPEITQNEAFSDSEEKMDSRSQPARFRDKTPAGSWSAELYSRPSGAAGNAPVEDVLLECALGDKAINAGASVVYAPAIVLPSFSFGHKLGHVVIFASGCVVEELGLTITNKGASKWTGRGSCAKVARAGKTTTTSGSTTTVIKLATGGSKLIDVGSRIEIGDDDNSGTGFAVTAVDEAADTITVSPVVGSAPESGETVRGFLPTA
ncbi:MAG: avidin/streptavidin family protein, partial [Desulfarculaceae bacterium]|nr:avidin/streptavidin family protein [Desulfarculaceae bacterium]